MIRTGLHGGVDRAPVAARRVSPTPRTEPRRDLSVAGTIFGRCVKRGTGRRHSQPVERGDAANLRRVLPQRCLPASARCQGSDVRRPPGATPARLSRRRASTATCALPSERCPLIDVRPSGCRSKMPCTSAFHERDWRVSTSSVVVVAVGRPTSRDSMPAFAGALHPHVPHRSRIFTHQRRCQARRRTDTPRERCRLV